MIREFKKKAILCVNDGVVFKNEKNEDCFNAWNKDNEQDTWLIPIEVLKNTYEEINVPMEQGVV